MNWKVSSLFCMVLVSLLSLVMMGCAGGNPIVVTPSLSGPQSVMAAQVLNLSVTIKNDSKDAGVTWTLSGSGTLSGQTKTSVTYTAPSPISAAATATVTATSVTDPKKSASITINLTPVTISLTPSTTQNLDQTQTLNVTATASNDPQSKGVTWSLSPPTGAGTLSGQSSKGVTYNAPASVTSATTVTLTATSVFDTTKTTPLTINLVLPPSVTTTSLAAGQVGVAYSAPLAAANGLTPYTWTITGGALPGGLTLSGSTISGTPSAYGTFNFTAQAKDAGGLTATANLSIKITPAPVTVTTTSLPSVVLNTPYSATLQATGGATPITWSVTVGSLPPGLTLASNGTISGTPTTAATSNFTVQATDSSTPALTGTKALSITVIPVLSITTSPLANGITSTAYSATLVFTGGSGTVNWSITVGSLPAGLNLNSGTGSITGTPTTAGVSNFTVQAADSGTPQQKVTKAFSITIIQKLTISTTSLPSGALTSNYSATLQSSGGTPALTWSIITGALPAGLTLNPATGAITGTPTASGTANFTAQVVDSGTPQQTASEPLSITIAAQLAISTTSLPSGSANTAYSATLQTNGGGIAPITWSITAGSLPPGLSLNASTGAISGTPTTATGSPFTFTVHVADSGTPQQTASQALSISIATAPLSVATTSLPNGVSGQAYNASLTSAGGNPPVTWSMSTGSLPSWATLNANTGAITGTPNATATTTFTVKATDSTAPTAQTATKQLSITVVAALSITTSSLPGGAVGTAYSATVNATGGTTPYSWSWAAQSGSSLPPGLSINSGTGAISGTPTTNTGSPFNVTVSVKDSASPQQSASANFSIAITVATLAVTTTSSQLPSGTVNTAYPSNVVLSASGGIPPYSWSQTAGALPPGLVLSSSGAITGTPTTATGSPFAFTVRVTDSATPTANTATANLSITVNATSACGSGNESLLNGQYAFLLKGFDNGTGASESGPEPVILGGVITVDGAGHITAGTMDINGYSTAGASTNTVQSGSSYTVDTFDNRGCMTITTAAGTQHFRFSLGGISGTPAVASTGHMINYDAAGPFTSGVLRKQNSAAFGTGSGQVTGNYAFGVSSSQNSSSCVNHGAVCGGGFGAIGVFDLAAGNVTGGAIDDNSGGLLDNNLPPPWPASPVSISAGGTYTVSSTNGRGTLVFPLTNGNVNSIIYVVSANEVLIMNSQDQTSNRVYGGTLLLQSSASFSTSSVSGNYVAYTSAPQSGGGGRTDLLLINANSGNFTATVNQNHAGTFASKANSGTYSVASNGRMLLTVTGNSPNPSIAVFLVSGSEAFILNDTSTADSGLIYSQTGGPFSDSSATGTYAFGSIDAPESSASINSGVATFTPATTSISVTQDQNSNSAGGGPQSATNSFDYSVDSTGLGLIPVPPATSCTISASSTTCQTIFYIISPTKAVVVDTQSSNPKVQIADK